MNSITLFSDNFAGSSRLGLGRYAFNLALELSKLDTNYKLIAANAYKVQNYKLDLDGVSFPQEQIGWGRSATAGLWTLLKFPPIEIWLPKTKLVHSLDLDYPIPTKRSLVVTIHDIGLLTHPKFFSAGYPWIKLSALKQAVHQAEAIICVSGATAFEVQDYLQQDLGKRIQVIPEGVDSVFYSEKKINIPKFSEKFSATNTPFFLYPGSVNPRKNLVRVLQAFEAVVNELPHHLVITGKLGWDSSEILQKVQNSPFAQRIHFIGFVSDIELVALYKKATALIYVSLFEGFGLPIIEAMASGCPVITSNFAPMSELAGDAAITINPLSVEELTNALLTIANDKMLIQSLIQKGKIRSQEFTWRRSAEMTAKIYQQIIGS
jgi:glycosyltransferase involved in cell wall biosynthesis